MKSKENTRPGRPKKAIDERYLYRITRLRLEGKPLGEIAETLSISFKEVNKYLEEATKNRQDYISINAPGKYLLEEQLKAKFKLKEVMLVDYINDLDELLERVGREASAYFSSIITDGYTIVVGGGNVLDAMINHITEKSNENIKVCAITNDPTIMLGEVERTISSPYLSIRLKEKFPHKSNELYLFSSPIQSFVPGNGAGQEKEGKILNQSIIPKDRQKRKEMLDHPSIKKVIQKTKDANIILYGIGDLETKDSTFIRLLDYYRKDSEKLKREGCVGAAGSILISKEGKWIKAEDDFRTIGMRVEDARRVAADADKYSIAITTGIQPFKNEPTLAAIKGGYLNVLIADTKIGEYLAQAKP
jgi:DNA-binding transcriptional regulator LsrR (DeoR family)